MKNQTHQQASAGLTLTLQRRGWDEEELAGRRKGDAEKLEVAARLRRETTLTIKAIAGRVGLGSSQSANAKLHRHVGRNRRAKNANPGQGRLRI